jgi:hypothetical protein
MKEFHVEETGINRKMTKMKAEQVPKAGADFEVVEREIPEPGWGQVWIGAQAY